MLTKYNICNYLVEAMRRNFIPFNSGFRIDTGLQFPPILSPEPLLPVPLFKPSKLRNTLVYTKYYNYMLFT